MIEISINTFQMIKLHNLTTFNLSLTFRYNTKNNKYRQDYVDRPNEYDKDKTSRRVGSRSKGENIEENEGNTLFNHEKSNRKTWRNEYKQQYSERRSPSYHNNRNASFKHEPSEEYRSKNDKRANNRSNFAFNTRNKQELNDVDESNYQSNKRSSKQSMAVNEQNEEFEDDDFDDDGEQEDSSEETNNSIDPNIKKKLLKYKEEEKKQKNLDFNFKMLYEKFKEKDNLKKTVKKLDPEEFKENFENNIDNTNNSNERLNHGIDISKRLKPKVAKSFEFSDRKLSPFDRKILLFNKQIEDAKFSSKQLKSHEGDDDVVDDDEEVQTTSKSIKEKLKQVYEYDVNAKRYKQLNIERQSNASSDEYGMVKYVDANNTDSQLATIDENSNQTNVTNFNDEAFTIEERIKNLRPAYRPFAYNLAYFVNDNVVLQKFIEMGVAIQHWDLNREICEFILKLNYERDVQPVLIFLHDIGLKSEDYPYVIYKCPDIFKIGLDTLRVRIKYLEEKKFNKENIKNIITKTPTWLRITVEELDAKLGWFQETFHLTASELREIIVTKPKLAILPLKIANDIRFCLKEALLYDDEQIKYMIKIDPKLFTRDYKLIKPNYNYLIDVFKLNDAQIREYPSSLYFPLVYLKSRFAYLRHLNMVQFDPTKPNFISLKDICEHTNETFCKKITKTSLDQFEKFLKTV